MSTADAMSTGTAAGSTPTSRGGGRRTALVGMAALSASIVLTACGPSYATYTDAYWDNGDGYLAPAKSALFDAEGNPVCKYPLPYQALESRGVPANLVSGFLYEVENPETPVDAPMPASADTPDKVAAETLKRERSLHSLPQMYQYTSLDFDKKYAITTPADLGPIKAELRSALPGIGVKEPWENYSFLSGEYVIADEGTYDLETINDPIGYLAENGVPLQFKGLEYAYMKATLKGTEYLLVRNKSTNEVIMYLGEKTSTLTNPHYFQIYDVDTNGTFHNGSEARLWLSSDGCPDLNNSSADRWFINDYAVLSGAETPSTDPSPEVSPTPGVSPSPSA